MEKLKQDDALSDLSDLLGELKVMAQDMGSEIERLVSLSSTLNAHVFFYYPDSSPFSRPGKRGLAPFVATSSN